MNKIYLYFAVVILLIGLVIGGGLVSKQIIFDTKTTSDLNKTGIKDFNMGEINCYNDICLATISKEGYFKTDIKADRYKLITLKNSTCENNNIKEINDFNDKINTQNKQIKENNKLIEEENQKLINEYEEKIKSIIPTYDEFENEIKDNSTEQIPYPTLRDTVPLLTLIFIDTNKISNDCSYNEKQLRTNDEIKSEIDEATKRRMNEIALYYNEKNKSKTKIDEAKIIEIK